MSINSEIVLPSLEDIIKVSCIQPKRIHNVTIFGSRVYGTYTRSSDWDVIMIANNSVENLEIKNEIFNIHIYTPDRFQRDLSWHRLTNLECIYAPEKYVIKKDINFDNFQIINKKLRHSIIHTSNQSWMKFQNKFNSGDYHIALKSSFHSMRIILFGLQILKQGRVTDFSSANYIWNKLLEKNYSMQDIKSILESDRINLLRQFSSCCE